MRPLSEQQTNVDSGDSKSVTQILENATHEEKLLVLKLLEHTVDFHTINTIIDQMREKSDQVLSEPDTGHKAWELMLQQEKSRTNLTEDEIATIFDKLVSTRQLTEQDVIDALKIAQNISAQKARHKKLVGGAHINKQDSPEAQVESYRWQYDHLDQEIQERCSWEDVKAILLAKNGHYLKLASKLLGGGGILFGIDEAGNPLFTDAGETPLFRGKNYNYARQRVLYGPEGNRNPTGYTLFPAGEEKNTKSPEIKMYEKFVEGPFVGQKDNGCLLKSWLESGQGHQVNALQTLVNVIEYNPFTLECFVKNDAPARESVRQLDPYPPLPPHVIEQNKPQCGARRMLRAEKSILDQSS